MSRQVEVSAGGATACPDDELLVPVPITIYLGPGTEPTERDRKRGLSRCADGEYNIAS
jgi:hypothetical protein